MTPLDYANEFLNMQVFLFSKQPDGTNTPAPVAGGGMGPVDEGIWVKTSVRTYRLEAATKTPGKDDYYFDDLTGLVRNGKKIKTRIKRVDGVIEGKEYTYDQIKYALVQPFYGKGYPEDAQLALQMRYRYQRTTFALADFVKAAFIGLDCSGFVGGFLERRKNQQNWLRTGASMNDLHIRDLFARYPQTINSWDQFRPPGNNSLILVLTDEDGNILDHSPDGGYGHIVITQPATLTRMSSTGPVKVVAVESTAAGTFGLQSGVYTIEKMFLDYRKTAYFLVDRGPNMGKKLHFRIAEVPD